MGFSLKNFVSQAYHQIDPWDHGQTAATVRQQQARPQAAQLPNPGQRSSIQQPQRSAAPQPQVRVMPTIAPLHIQQPSIQHQSFQQPQLHVAVPGQSQGIHVGNQVVQQAPQAPQAHVSMTQPTAPLINRIVNQVNPLDNGRTFKQLTQTNTGSALRQIQNSGAGHVVTPAITLGKGIATGGAQAIGTPVELARAATAHFTGNQPAQNAAIGRLKTDANAAVGIARAVPDMAYQLGESVNPLGGDVYNRSHTFTNPVAKAVFGSTPLPSMQTQYKQDVAQHGKGYAMGAAATTAVMDALGAKGLAGKSAPPLAKGADVAKGFAKNQATTMGELARGVKNPHPDVSPEDYMSLRRVTNHAQGGPEIDRPVSAGDLVATRSLLKQKGYDPNDLSAADHIVNQISGYEAKKQAIQGGYVQDPFRAAMDKSKQLVGQYTRVANQGEQLASQVDRAHNIAHKGNGTSREQMALGKFMDQRLGLKTLNEGGFINVPGGKTQLNNNGKPTITTKAADAGKLDIGEMAGDAIDTAKKLAGGKQSKESAGEAAPTKLPGEQAGGIASSKGTPDTVISRFPNRLLEDNRTEPIHKTLLQNVTHDVKHNNDVLAQTSAKIAKNEDAALTLAKRGTSTEANATAMQLLNKYLQEGSFDKADELVPVISPRFTRQGQETQILAAFSKLQPAGAVRYAARQVEKAAYKTGQGKRLEDLTATTHQAVSNTAKEVASQLETEVKQGKVGKVTTEKEPKTPEKMLADRIKTGVSQKKQGPDPIKDMVNTLHGVAKEIIPEQLKKAPRDPMQLVGQAIKDKAAYKDVWDKAQKIVAEKYKDNPHALEELDKYFNSSLARPFSKGQLNRGVQQGLKGTDLSKLVKEHYTKVDETGQELRDKLIERAGLSKAEATQLSGDIQSRYDQLVSERKDSLIKQMFGERPTPEQKTAVDKVLTMHNLGALTRDEIRPLIAKKLGLQTLSKENTATIAGMAENIQRLPEGSMARNKATFEMMDYIHKLAPSSVGKQLVETWRSLLLTAPTTTGGNVVGNGVEAVTQQALVNPVAALFDLPTSLITGKRSRALTTPMPYLRGAGKGLKNAGTYLKTGFDPLDSSAKYEAGGTAFSNNLAGKVADKTTSGIYRFLGAQDQPFRYGAREQALAEQAKVDGINSGLHGNQLSQYVKERIANPTVEQTEHATNEGARAVFGNDTIMSQLASKVKQPVSLNGKEVYSGAAGEFVVPFSKVPASIATRIVERSPLGYVSAANDIVQAMRGKGFDQYRFTEKLANATVGSAGALVVGKALADHNMISLGYPTTDQKEAQDWQATGRQPYSVKIGGTWHSLNYIQPFGSMLAYGAAYSQARKKGMSVDQAASSAAGEAAKAVTSQSFLQGVSGAINAVQSPEQSAGKYINSAVGGVVPNLVRRVASASDSVQRQTNNLGQAIEAGIPGMRSNLLPKQDVYGNDIPRGTGAINSFLNPLKPSYIHGDAVTREVDRLKDSNPADKSLEVTPLPVDKVLSIEGNKVKLTDKQRYDLQKQVGQATDTAWGDLIKTSEYQAMTDPQKAAALTNIRQLAVEDAQRTYVVNNNLGTYNKPESKKAVAYSQGTKGIADLASSKATGKTSTTTTADYNSKPDAQYKAALDSYNKNKATMNDAQRIKAETSLHKLEIGSKYDKNVRDLYGMSKAQAYNYVSKSPNGKAVADQLIAYDNALYDAGLTSYRKYSNGIAPAASSKRSSGSSRTTSGSKRASSGTKRSSGGSRANPNTPTKALASYAKFGSSSAFKYENSLRGLVAKTLKAPKVKGTNQTARVKKYKAPSVKIATNPKPRKAFA